MAKAKLIEKIGYGFGDMSTSTFWKVFSYYLPIFYSNIFGLSLIDAGVLVLVTRIWDAVSDPMMGIIADRTNTKWGKYRPYLLWVAPFFTICGILLFTTPDWSFIALFIWEPLTNALGGYMSTDGWFWAMVCVASACFVMFIISFLLTKEHLKGVSTVSVGSDFKSLLDNKPWWILIGAALCSNLFNTVRGATVAYFFLDIIGPNVSLSFFGIMFLFYSGLFLGVGEVANMAGVALCVPIASKLGKKTTFIFVNAALVVLSIAFFFVPCTPLGFWMMLILQVVISIFTGVMSPLIWSMYADVSDYAELKFRTASTGLIFSSASMAQKFGGAISGAAVLWLLSAFGYITDAAQLEAGAVQPESALMALRWLMSFIPAAVAALAMVVVWFYPLTRKRVHEISNELKKIRSIE